MPKKSIFTPDQQAEKARIYSREYYRKNKEKIALRDRTDPKRIESLRNADERRRAKDQGRESKAPAPRKLLTEEERKESDRISAAKYLAKNPEISKERKQQWREANSEIAKQLSANWWKQNPHKRAEYSNRRRMLLENQPDVDLIKWKQTLELFDYKCLYCRAQATSLDHVVPIAKGGTNHHTNCVPACTRCNSSKGSKHLGQWIQSSKIAKEALSRPYDWQPPEKANAT